MRKRTHIITGISFSYLIGLNPLLTLIVVFGTVAPDLDVKMEKMKHRLKFIPSWMTHRGITHWWGIPLLLFGLSLLYKPILYLGIGWSLHLLADALNPSGIPVYPFNKKKRIRLLPEKLAIRYNSFGELLFVILLLVVTFLIKPVRIP